MPRNAVMERARGALPRLRGRFGRSPWRAASLARPSIAEWFYKIGKVFTPRVRTQTSDFGASFAKQRCLVPIESASQARQRSTGKNRSESDKSRARTPLRDRLHFSEDWPQAHDRGR